MLTTELSNTRFHPLNIMACAVCCQTIKTPSDPGAFETAICGDHCYIEPVYTKAGGEHWEHDIRTVIDRKLIATDTIVFKLFRNGVEVATLNDNTYGTYYATFAEQPLQTGFSLDFDLVFAAFGVGRYVIKTEATLIGVVQPVKQTHVMQLYPYSEKIADGFVKLETYQNGNIESFALDYTGINWYQAIRIPGRFFIDKPPKKIKDAYPDSLRTQKQIQDEMQFSYLLETHMVPSCIANFLWIDAMLSNVYLATDYNLTNADVFRRKEVYPESVDEVVNGDRTRFRAFQISFSNSKLNILKRNF